MSIPVRVFAVDYRGVDFTEDATTVTVNLHGAKLRMAHQLLPDQEIRLVSQYTREEALFRVVSKVESSDLRYTYWGVEILDQDVNIWGVPVPALRFDDRTGVRVVLQCPTCAVRESIRVDEKLLAMLSGEGGIPRACASCHDWGQWKILPFQTV